MPVTADSLRKRALKRNFSLKLRRNGGFRMEPGELPFDRIRTTLDVDNPSQGVGYLHSSIAGFNAEYRQIGESFSILTQLRELRANTVALCRQMVQELLKRSNAAKTQVFHISAAEDIMLAPALQLLYKKGDMNDLRSQMLELKLYAMNPYDITDYKIIKEHDAQILRLKQKTVEQRAEEMKQKIESMLNWINSKDPEQHLKQNDLIKFLDETLQQLNHQVTPFGLQYTDHNDKVNFHQKLGFVFESMLEGYFALCTQRGLTEETIMEKIGGFTLNDLISGKRFTIDVEQNITDKLGISAKFGITNKFEIHPQQTGGVNRSIRNILDVQGINNLSGLAELQYFYDNWVALSVFSSENDHRVTPRTWSTGDRSQIQHQQKRSGARLLMGSAFKQVFTALADYIYLVLVTQALFGNAVDFKNSSAIPLLDADYMPTLVDKTIQGKHTPPAFLFTSHRAFETGRLFDMIIQDVTSVNSHGNDTVHKSVQALFKTFSPTSGYSATAFEELYDEKCEALIGAMNSGETSTIYDTLFSRDIRTIRGFDPFTHWFNRDRAFKITFDPLKYV